MNRAEFSRAQLLILAAAVAGVALGYFGCWLDDATNRHKYTNRTVSADVARPPETPPGDRTPPAAENSNDAVGGRQRAGWLAWLLEPRLAWWLRVAATLSIAFWLAIELLTWQRERDRRRNMLTLRVAPGVEFSRELKSHAEADRERASGLAWPAGTVGLIEHGTGELAERCEAFTLETTSPGAEAIRVELLGCLFDGRAKPGDEVKIVRDSFRPYLDDRGRPMQKRPHEGKGNA